MRTLIKLVIAALVLHGTWRLGSAYLTRYRFEDDLQRLAQFAGEGSEEVLRDRVVTLAREYQVPLNAEAIRVTRSPGQLLIETSYTQGVQILPLYQFPWRFDTRVRAWSATHSAPTP
jgi:hypothetical protein